MTQETYIDRHKARRLELRDTLNKLYMNGHLKDKDHTDLSFAVLCWENSEKAIDTLMGRGK